jgi:hypothetical protein
MIRVLIESPLGTRPDGTRATPSEFAENELFMLACVGDSLRRGEAPFASHMFYPLVLNDATPEERELGVKAGFAWGEQAELVAVYVERGITNGMRAGIKLAVLNDQRIVYRVVGDDQNYLNEQLTLKGSVSPFKIGFAK